VVAAARQFQLDAVNRTAPGGTINPSQRATGVIDQPCTSSEITTTMNATLNMPRPLGVPPSIGTIASKIETAPRNPTQATNATSWRENRKPARLTHTASGRATTIRTIARMTAGTRT
jgi:hypothetical protein